MAVIERIGTEILVDSGARAIRIAPNVTSLADGRFVVVWEEEGSAYSGGQRVREIKAQFLTSEGEEIGSEFRVNTRPGQDSSSSVEALPTGGFVVSWTKYGVNTDGNGTSIAAQVFADDGSKIGGELVVNTQKLGNQLYSDVTVLTNGGFVIGWEDTYTDAWSNTHAQAQIFAADGTKVGTEFLVNRAISSPQGAPELAALDDGGFVATWQGQVGSAQAQIWAQMFDASGNRSGEYIQVSPSMQGAHSPDVTKLNNGNFVIAWARGAEVRAQVFDSTGAKIGAEIQGPDAANAITPSVAAVGDDDFIISWSDFTGAFGDTDLGGITAQLFDGSGTAMTSPFRVNSNIADVQAYPRVAGSVDGHALIVWDTRDPRSVDMSISAQAYLIGDSANAGVTITSDGGATLAAIAIGENNSAVTIVSATAQGAATPIVYSISGGNDASFFSINPATGALSFNTPPDFERPADAGNNNVYNVIVHASAGAVAASQEIDVRVTDVPEEAGAYYGTAAADVMIAPDENDWILYGLAGADVLTGRSGDDTIYGGAGKDRLTGGEGADTFVFEINDSKAGGGVRDVITDFVSGVDKLDLSALHIDDFANDVTFKAVGSGLIVYVDTNHNGFDYSDFGVQLTGVTSLQNSDFIL